MNIAIPTPFQPLFRPKRYKIFYGGRYGAKSYNIALALLIKGIQNPTRILCTRELQVSITDSVHKLLSDLNTKHNFGYKVTNNSLTHPNGSEFMFVGLKMNITKVKSMEGVDIVWVEEGENVSSKSWEVLIPTIRALNSEIWVSFNPDDESDPTYLKFITPYLTTLTEHKVYEDDHVYVRKINYDENPYCSQTMLTEINKLRDDDYDSYLHVYQGEPLADHEMSLIQPSWFDACIDAHTKLNFEGIGDRTIGHDVADGGGDSAAFVYRHGSVVQSIEEWTVGNLETGCQKVFDFSMDHRVKDVIYDSVGVGAGARVEFNRLDPQKNVTYSGFSGNASVTPGIYKDDRANKDVFKNLRAQYYWLLRDRFYNTFRAITEGAYIDPAQMISIDSNCKNIKTLKAELTKIQRKSGTGNVIQIESKADMKKRGMKSPGCSDALVYAFGPTKPKVEMVDIDFTSGWD